MAATLLWSPEADGSFHTTALMDSMNYRKLLRHTGKDLNTFDEIAKELTLACKRTPFTRFKLFWEAGRPVRQRIDEMEQVLREHLGGKVEFRVVGANTGVFQRGGPWAIVAALFSPLEPVVWVNFVLL